MKFPFTNIEHLFTVMTVGGLGHRAGKQMGDIYTLIELVIHRE